MEVKSIPRLELIQVAEAVSREKSIEKEEVIIAMEEAIQKAARSKYGLERDIRANIDRKNGSINISKFTEVVEEMSNHIYINKVEIERLKNELGYPNDLDEQAEELFNILAEENAE